MAGQPRTSDTDWLRAAVDRFEKPLTLYAARFLGDAERRATWFRTRSCGSASKTARTSSPTWRSGCSPSAATARPTSYGRRGA